jgi:large subunit ribosomal protein L18
MDKKLTRIRRATRGRSTMKRLSMVRLCVHRTPCHMYAQIIDPNAQVLASASTLDTEFKHSGYFGNVAAAKKVGILVAERALKLGIKKIAFDRAGFKYHGRVKALADAAREAGLEF